MSENYPNPRIFHHEIWYDNNHYYLTFITTPPEFTTEEQCAHSFYFKHCFPRFVSKISVNRAGKVWILLLKILEYILSVFLSFHSSHLNSDILQKIFSFLTYLINFTHPISKFPFGVYTGCTQYNCIQWHCPVKQVENR